MSDPSPTPQIVIQQKESLFGRFGKFLLVALLFAIVTIIGMQSSYKSYFNPTRGPQEKFHSGSETATKKIAIINVTGIISEANTFYKAQIDKVRKDEDVVAVVLRINSPGGTVTYSDYLHHHLREMVTGKSREGEAEGKELPIVVSMGSVCASGGYMLAMAVGDKPDTLIAEPATLTGSIGVILTHYDLSGLLDEWSIQDDSITSHDLKDMGSPTKTMTEEERAIFQDLVDGMLVDFKETVMNGRPIFRDNPADLDAVATGQVFTAKQAVELKLIDKIGFIEDALDRAAELANTKVDDVRCVRYDKPPAALDALLGSAQTQSRSLTIDIDSLLELSVPRAYYMCTWLPSVVKSGR
ncbi:MAG: signal peptide peptidase SppA [Aeoliella sp.]